MKRLLLCLLCSPLACYVGLQGYYLVERERLLLDEAAPTPARQAETADDAVVNLATLQKAAVLLGNRPLADPQHKEFQELASALHKHGQNLHEARENLITWADAPRNLKGKYEALWKRLQGPSENIRKLRAELANADPAAVSPDLRKLIRICQESWGTLLADAHVLPRDAKKVIEFLEDTQGVVDTTGVKNVDKLHFLRLEKIAKADASPELTVLAVKLAGRLAFNRYWSAEPLKYDSHVEFRTDKEWPRVNPEVFLIKVYSKDKKLDYLSAKGPGLQLQFEKEGPIWTENGNLDQDTEEGKKGYRNRLRPTQKSLLAHAYNQVGNRLRDTTSLGGRIQDDLWTEYQVWASKNKDRREEIKGKNASFVIDELAKHHQANGQKLKDFLAIVDECPALFARAPIRDGQP